MSFKIITEYSLWLLPLCLLLGLAYAFMLYYREKRYEWKKSLIRIFFVLRTLAIFLISFLLLSPLVMTRKRTIEKPLIIVAQDNSQSLLFHKDSAAMRTDYTEEMKKLVEKLEDDYEVKTFSFGDKVTDKPTFDFNDKQTDFAELFDEVQARYANRNIGAVVLASDGLYNKGSNPLYLANEMKFPFYTVALGDTNIQKDMIISRVNYNRISYLGNQFPLEIVVSADKFFGQKATLIVGKGNETLFSKTLDINGERYIETTQVVLESKQPGVQHYRISISALPGEISIINNVQDVYVEVLDGREKILLLAGAPHPDVAALKQSIENSNIYQVEAYIADNFNKSVSAYNMVILHQIPFKGKNHQALLQGISEQKVPVLFVIGASSDVSMFNSLKTGLNIKKSTDKYDEAEPSVANDFALFTISDELKKLSANYPALLVPFGEYNISNAINVLFYQKIGSVQTQRPLLMFNNTGDSKIGIISGEGIWRWRLNNFLQSANHNAFNELTNKMIQFLSVKVDKGRFRINNKNRFMENESVEFDAEVYNESYELINEPEVKIAIINSENKSFPYTFSRTAHAYHLNAGVFPLGEYRYNAQVKVGGELLQKSGAFSVAPVNVEALNLIADHQMLYSMSVKNNGKMLYPGQLSTIPELLKVREDVKSISYSRKSFSDLVNMIWVLALIILLLSAEWFLRRRYGAY